MKKTGSCHDPEPIPAVFHKCADETLQLWGTVVAEPTEMNTIKTHETIHRAHPEEAI